MRVPPTGGDFSSRDFGDLSSSPSQELAKKLAHDITTNLKELKGKLTPGEMVSIFHTLREKMTELLNVENGQPRDFTQQQRQTAESLNDKIQNMADQMAPPTADQILDALDDAQQLLA